MAGSAKADDGAVDIGAVVEALKADTAALSAVAEAVAEKLKAMQVPAVSGPAAATRRYTVKNTDERQRRFTAGGDHVLDPAASADVMLSDAQAEMLDKTGFAVKLKD